MGALVKYMFMLLDAAVNCFRLQNSVCCFASEASFAKSYSFEWVHFDEFVPSALLLCTLVIFSDKTSFTSCTRTVHNGVGHFFIQLKNNVVLAKVKIRTFDNIKQRYAGCYVFRLCLHRSSSAVTDRMTSDGAEACYDAVASRTCAHFADYVFISWCCDRCPGWSSIMVPASLHLFCYLYVLFRTF